MIRTGYSRLIRPGIRRLRDRRVYLPGEAHLGRIAVNAEVFSRNDERFPRFNGRGADGGYFRYSDIGRFSCRDRDVFPVTNMCGLHCRFFCLRHTRAVNKAGEVSS
jgi:hypothetical protein